MKTLITTVALSVLALAAPSHAASTGAEIKAALVGNTFQGGMGGSNYTSYFGEDGTYKDASSSGKYTIEGDNLCYAEMADGCYQVTITGDKMEWMKNGKSEGTGTIVRGNPNNF